MASSEPATTQERYLIENAKRLTSVNYDLRIELSKSSSLADTAQDHWADYDSISKQEPLLTNGSRTKILIVGAGHAGLVNAYHLIASGFSSSDIVIIDAAGGWGGTWYWNRYPGLQCDVEGYCYLPLLEESGFVPSNRYSKGEEIRRNAEHIATTFKLQGMFCTRLVGADWNEQEGRWDVRLRRDLGPAYASHNVEFLVSTQFLVSCVGVNNSPSIPALPGVEEFRREHTIFHTARWDYEYTGGSQHNPQMTNLQDKVIGIIGTAASSVQAAPELAKWAKHLYIFQRTPVYIGPHEDMETSADLWAKVTKGGKGGWQQERMENLNLFFTDDPEATPENNLVQDERSRFPSLSGVWGSRRGKDLRPEDAATHLEWMLKREEPHSAKIRKHITTVVKDPSTAEKLLPWYPGWCKRPAFNNTYLQAFNRDNVTLVDTDGQGVQGFTSTGVITGSGNRKREYQLDAVVLATGFELAGASYSSVAAAQAYYCGRNGRDFNEKWNSHDFSTHFGIMMPEFPNLFLSIGANTAASANLTSVYNSVAKTSAYIIKEASSRSSQPDRLVIEADKQAAEGWTARVLQLATWFSPLSACPPTFFTNYKRDAVSPEELEIALKKASWPLGPVDYDHVTSDYRKSGTLAGVVLSN